LGQSVIVSIAADIFQQGGILAYPTEAVFGLGCDPDNISAIENLLTIKKRPKNKGLILLAAHYSQLLPYIDDSKLTQVQRQHVLSRWPNGVTQLLPKNKQTLSLLTGEFDRIAVRLTDQPDVVSLCAQTNKPIVSTSANLSGQPPATTWQNLSPALINFIDYIIKGDTLGYTQPSTIIDALTERVIRS
jgi:L-threonylcarbamoyladenylate synthase